MLRASEGAIGSSSALNGLSLEHSSSAVPPAAKAAGAAAAAAAASAAKAASAALPQRRLSPLKPGLANGGGHPGPTQTADQPPDSASFEVRRCEMA